MLLQEKNSDSKKQWKLDALAIQGNSRLVLYKPKLILATRNFDLQMYAYANGQGGNCNPCIENRFPSNIQFIEPEAVVKANNNNVDPIGFVYLLQVRGNKQYELCNHFGNSLSRHLSWILATISDRKWSRVLVGTNANTDYFLPYIISIADYYVFAAPRLMSWGSSMAERSWSAKNYRYGFNNQEQDSELGVSIMNCVYFAKEITTHSTSGYTFKYRIHSLSLTCLGNASLGRFMSVDSLAYQFVMKSVILMTLAAVNGTKINGKNGLFWKGLDFGINEGVPVKRFIGCCSKTCVDGKVHWLDYCNYMTEGFCWDPNYTGAKGPWKDKEQIGTITNGYQWIGVGYFNGNIILQQNKNLTKPVIQGGSQPPNTSPNIAPNNPQLGIQKLSTNIGEQNKCVNDHGETGGTGTGTLKKVPQPIKK